MAIVESFVELTGRNGRRHPTALQCGYFVFEDAQRERILQLDTFGSKDRKSEQKQSQTLQLTERAAEELIAVVRAAFPRLA